MEPRQSIRGIRDELAQENILLFVQGMDEDLQQLLHLGLEAVFRGWGLFGCCHLGILLQYQSTRFTDYVDFFCTCRGRSYDFVNIFGWVPLGFVLDKTSLPGTAVMIPRFC
jgi:hypothetical protein